MVSTYITSHHLKSLMRAKHDEQLLVVFEVQFSYKNNDILT